MACSEDSSPTFRRDRRGAALLASANRRATALDPPIHAAWTMVASTILNLDETITKQ